MRRLAVLVAIAALTPAAAFAQGINLAWDDCFAGGGQPNKDPLCSGVPQERALVVSVQLNAAVDGIVGTSGVIDLRFDAPDVPDYWRFDTGGCLQGGLVGDPVIGLLNPPFSCPTWAAAGQVAGGIHYSAYVVCNNRARIQWAYGLLSGSAQLDPAVGSEWYLLRLRVIGGSSSCGGCTTPACLVASQIILGRAAGDPRGDLYLTGPGISQHATWADNSLCPSTAPPDCPTPVRATTWGEIKGLYR